MVFTVRKRRCKLFTLRSRLRAVTDHMTVMAKREHVDPRLSHNISRDIPIRKFTGVQRINVCSTDRLEAETQYVLTRFMACAPRTYSNEAVLSRHRIGTKTTT